MFDNPTLVSRLSKVRHFRVLPPTAIYEIVTAGTVQTFSAGSTIFHEGWECAGLYVLFRGKVHLCKTSYQGQESIISVIKPVIMFNEVATLDGGENPITALAEEKSTTWCINRQRFLSLVEKYPVLGLSLLTVLARRNRRLIDKYEDLIARPVKARTAKIILDLSSFGSHPVDRITNSNQFIAASISTVPEAVSRAIKSLRETGVIECTRTQIFVRNLDELADLAQIELEMFRL